MPKENIYRLKEVLLLIFFFTCVLSFSNKSFGRSIQNEDSHKLKKAHTSVAQAILSHQDLAKLIPIVPEASKKSHSENLNNVRIIYENKKVAHEISLLHSNFLSIKPQISSRFYYRLFTLRGELPV